MSINQNFQEVYPSLTLDFANSKTLDPRITFTRSSTGTYVGADGLIKTASADEARFDHDSSTGESLGLLIEESRTNLLPESEDFSTSGLITKLAITTSNDAGVIAPDGTAGATRVIQDNTTAQHLIGDSAGGLTLGGYYTLSTFVKAGTTDLVWVSVNSYTNWVDDWNFFINLTTGSVYHNSNNISSAKLKVEEYPNGWWRVSMVAQQEPAGSGAGGLWLGHANPDLSNSSNFAGDGSTYFYAWGFQMEAGSFPTSYIHTSGSTVTRAVDDAGILGDSFNSFFNPSEGSVICKYKKDHWPVAAGNDIDFERIWEIGDGTDANNLNIFNDPSQPSGENIRYRVRTSSTNVFGPATLTTGTNQTPTVALGYAKDNFVLVIDGTPVNTDTSGDLPVVDRLYIGGRYGNDSSDHFNNTISKLFYYPERLTNTQLQNLTK